MIPKHLENDTHLQLDILDNAEEDPRADLAVNQVHELEVEQDDNGLRLDQYLTNELEYSRSLIQQWIKEGRVMLGQSLPKASTKVKVGNTILLEVPPLQPAAPIAQPEIPLQVVYEDGDIIVINKQRGLVVHPAVGNPDGTLVNALLGHCSDLSGIRGISRPGIVHRIDRDTTGLMVVAKHDRAHIQLQQQFQNRTVHKLYHCVVHGVPTPASATIDQPLARHPVHRKKMAIVPDGKRAISDYSCLKAFDDQFALVAVKIHTGRTHQIRVHMSSIHNPLVGDPVYGKRKNTFGFKGQCLHCRQLGIMHPIKGEEMLFEAPYPKDMQKLLTRLEECYPDLI